MSVSSSESVFHRISSKWNRLYAKIKDIFGYFYVLFAVAAPFATAVAGLFWVNQNLPRQIAFEMPEVVEGTYFVSVCIVAAFLLGLTMVSAYIIQKQYEQRHREESFYYDRHGTLFNGQEPNISFRTETFKGLLEDIADTVEPHVADYMFVNAGRRAAKDFAETLPEIMDREILQGRRWNRLSFPEKINYWSKYDSATGWGHLVARRSGRGLVTVRVSHYSDLLTNEGGKRFAQFLAGYAETVLSKIVEGHNDGAFEDYNHVELRQRKHIGMDTIELLYALEG